MKRLDAEIRIGDALKDALDNHKPTVTLNTFDLHIFLCSINAKLEEIEEKIIELL